MKKAFSLKKKLPKVLAVALAAACFAGAVPANAAGVTRAYSTIGSYGSFEEYMWYLCDNVKGDKVTFTTVDGVTGIPVVTKGANEAAADWASLATRNMTFAAGGKYQVSFAIKSTDASGWFKLSGKKFSEDLATHGDIVYNSVSVDGASAAEAYVGNEWKNVVAEFTVDGTKPVNQFRIYLRGNAGTQLTIKDFDVRKIDDRVIISDKPYLDAKWQYVYSWTTDVGYMNHNLDNCKIELMQDGCEDTGAVHFYKNGEPGKELRIHRVIPNALMSTGKTYVFEANIKGTTTEAPNGMYVEFLWGTAVWTSNNSGAITLESRENWEKISYEFSKPNDGDVPICIKTGGYTTADYYIDNIVIYDKEDTTKTNIIPGGDFYATEPATTLNGWTGSYFGNSNLAYNNPDTDTCRITLVNDGADDAGAVYFHRENTEADGRPTARILYQIPNAILEKFAVGTEFVLEAKTKGKSPSPGNDSMKFSLEFSPYVWTDGSDVVYNYELNSSSWVTFTKEFKKNAAGDLFIIVRSGGYTAADFYLDNVKVYAKDDASRTNLIANGDFCEKEAVVSDSSAVDNSPYKVNNVPGFDIGMLNDVLGGDKDISVVPGGSYDGSTAVEIRGGDKAERYFQQLDGVKFVLGDTAVKATGYFKVTAGNTEPKIWLGFGKSYGGANSVGLHFANYLKNGKPDSGESFTARDDGWYYFEKTVDTGTFNNKIDSMTELVWVKYMCGIDARTNTGAARFDNITCEIISSAEPGDANNDGEINILDMVRMKKYSAGNESFENITRGMWLTENTDGAAALAALKKVIIGASSEYGK